MRIAGLRQRRDGADLGKAETHAEHGIGHARVLVEACGDAERIRKREPPQADRQARIIGRRGARIDAGLERFQGELVGGLGRQREQQRAGEVECGCKHLSACPLRRQCRRQLRH